MDAVLPARPAATDPDASALLEAVRAAALLGWLSVVAVLVGLAVGLPVQHDAAVLGATIAGAAGHASLGLLPWARLLPTRRGRILLNLWSGALVAGVCGLVLTAGGASRMDLVFFLVVPFLAMVHDGRALVGWLLVAVAAFLASTLLTSDPLPRAEAVLHLVLLGASAALGRQLAGAIRRQTLARVEAIRRAELEGAMLAEGHHRVKNSLQVVADLLLLGRPSGADPASVAAFEHAESRIRSIAAVHDVLADRRGGRVPAADLLRAVLAAAGDAVVADVAPVELPFQQAQHLGVVVNELVVNAHQHGSGAVRVALTAGDARPTGARGRERTRLTLTVADEGGGPGAADWDAPGLGLRLVRQVVEQGLGGTLERGGDAGAVTVRFDVEHDARPGR